MFGIGSHPFKARTESSFLTLGMRFERFLPDFTALLDRFVAMFIASLRFGLELRPLSYLAPAVIENLRRWPACAHPTVPIRLSADSMLAR
jgi:hypothetical protein